MKKILSVILTIAMIASAMSVMTITTSANGEWTGESTFNGDDENSNDIVEALYFENPPTIDGYVSEAEWGERTVELYSDQCGTQTNDGEELYASFFYWKEGHWTDNPMEMLMWLRWDEDNFYVALIARDYDGHSLKHAQGETWNGDSIEFRVDKDGPNAAHGGSYDRNQGEPWSSEHVPHFMVGYSEIAGGFTEVYEGSTDKGLTEYSKPALGAVNAVVAPAGSDYSADTAAGYTTYEIAIPWKYIYQNELGYMPESQLSGADKTPYDLTYTEYNRRSNPKGGIGQELGMSIVLNNAAEGESSYKSIMAWGSCINTTYQCQEYIEHNWGGMEYNPNAHLNCSGSNCVTLVADEVEQGSYDFYDPSVLEEEIKDASFDDVFYDYLGGDIGCTTPVDDNSALTTLTYDSDTDMEYWGSPSLFQGSTMDVGGEHGKVLNYDRALYTYERDGVIYEAGVAPIDSFYISTEVDYNIAYTYPVSYTFEMDVMYTSLDVVEPGYASSLGNWFGGASSVEYYCGYSFVDQRFVACEAMRCGSGDYIAMSDPYDLKVNTWYNWKFQFDNETCTTRLYIDDELVLEVSNRYFYYSSEQHLSDGAMMILWFVNTQIKMDNVKMYNFYDYENATAKGSLKGTVDVRDNDNPTDDPVVVNIFKNGEDTVYKTAIADADGNYEFKNLPLGEYFVEILKEGFISQHFMIELNEESPDYNALTRLYQFGDIDTDGCINAKDAYLLKQIIVGIEQGGNYYDLNRDAYVNAKDLLLLKHMMIGH